MNALRIDIGIQNKIRKRKKKNRVHMLSHSCNRACQNKVLPDSESRNNITNFPHHAGIIPILILQEVEARIMIRALQPS